MVYAPLALFVFAALAEAGQLRNWLALDSFSTQSRGHLRVSGNVLDGCKDDEAKDGMLLCEHLPVLGDGVCDAADLQRILATVQGQGWHGDKVGVIRSESPHGWIPVPALQLKSQLGPPSSAWQTLHSQGVYMLENFLSSAEADTIVAGAQSRSPITSEVTEPAMPTCGFRRSTSWVFFGHEMSEALFPKNFQDRMEGATHVPRKHYEATQVVEYLPGDFFSDHYDTSVCDHIGDHQLEEVSQVKRRKSVSCDEGSRRQGTLIVYLTDETTGEGGATYFPKLDVRVKPKKGRAIFFRPTRADGSTDPWMLHSAETLLSGKKFLLQQWMMHGDAWR